MADSQYDGVLIAHSIRLFGDSFSDAIGSGGDFGTFPPTVTTVGSGSGSVAGGQLTLTNGGSGPTDSASLQSNLTAPVLTGSSTKFQASLYIPTGYTNMSVVARSGSTDTHVHQGSFSPTAAPIRSDTYHTYDIVFRAPGVVFFIMDNVTIFQMPGATLLPRVQTMNLPLRYEIGNSGQYSIARWGAFNATNGYFFEVKWVAVTRTINVRDTGVFQIGVTADSLVSAPTTGKKTLDTSIAQLTATNIPCRFGVQVKADDDNSGTIWVGRSSVTAGTTDATDGFKLKAGQGKFFPIRNANLLYGVASATSQIAYWSAA